ncbi:hypothetical protein O1L55_31625, partial [Streptomyces albulus]|nr:hypothetical protein [Streptomyces noursei]
FVQFRIWVFNLDSVCLVVCVFAFIVKRFRRFRAPLHPFVVVCVFAFIVKRFRVRHSTMLRSIPRGLAVAGIAAALVVPTAGAATAASSGAQAALCSGHSQCHQKGRQAHGGSREGQKGHRVAHEGRHGHGRYDDDYGRTADNRRYDDDDDMGRGDEEYGRRGDAERRKDDARRRGNEEEGRRAEGLGRTGLLGLDFLGLL